MQPTPIELQGSLLRNLRFKAVGWRTHEGHFLKEKVLNVPFDASATFKTSYSFKKGLQILKRKMVCRFALPFGCLHHSVNTSYGYDTMYLT